MAAPRKITPEAAQAAREAIRRGSTKAAEAAKLGVSPRALGFAFDRYKAPARKPPTDLDDETAEFEADAKELGLTERMNTAERIAVVTKQIRQAQSAYDSLMASGELSEARRFGDLITKASSVLERIERGLDTQDAIPRAEIDAKRAQARARQEAFVRAHDKLRCADCQRKISIFWAHDPLAPKAGTDDE